MLCDIESELEDSCDCFERALELAREFFPEDKDLYNTLLSGQEHARWIHSLVQKREYGVINDK
ncbi:MAG: hypothetical protein WC479_10635 [Candidatus Izemoplasmatales bacterium]